MWWPSSKSIGPPPQISGLKRQAQAASGTCQAVGLKPALLLMRMVSGSPISAGVDQGLGAHDGRVEDEVFVDPQGLFGGSRGRDHLVGFGQGERHRLLDGDVLAGGEGVQGHGIVKVMGQQDLDQVEVGQGKQVVVVVEDTHGRHAPLGCPPTGALLVDIADSHDPGAFALEIFDGVQVADTACSDDPNTQHRKTVAPRLSSRLPRRSGSCPLHFQAAQVDKGLQVVDGCGQVAGNGFPYPRQILGFAASPSIFERSARSWARDVSIFIRTR